MLNTSNMVLTSPSLFAKTIVQNSECHTIDIIKFQQLMFISFISLEPEIPDITQEEEAAEGEGGEQAQGEAAPAEDAEPKEQALGVSTPTGEGEEGAKKGLCYLLLHVIIFFLPKR